MANKMKITLIMAFIAVLTVAQVTYPTYEEYAKQFGKKYQTKEQYEMRQKIYNENIQYFGTVTSFVPGVNGMTDWTPSQIKARKNLQQIDDSQKTIRVPPSNGKLGAPASLDWRQQGVVTSIKNQASCGACTTFASAAVAESFLIINKRFTNTTINLSQQYLLSCTPQTGCNGGYLQYTMQKSRQLPSESQYPYLAKPTSGSICSASTLKVALSSNNYYNLTDTQIINLLQSGPIAISISAYQWEYYSSGVFSCKAGVQVDHAVVIVGYTSSYWIVKNQWGQNWGINGYIHITRNRTNNCAIGNAAFTFIGSISDTSNDKNFVYTSGSSSDANNQANVSPINNNSNSIFSLFGWENKILLQAAGIVLFFVFIGII